ncbi:hypothetical protein JVU11DRAFT_6837 [Chiua virens]|nr:hypothetical protein JVU11DRAFT_6837 [Chiua virens]
MSVPPIFSSSPAVKALVTLILIENSQRMRNSWSDLRHYLPTLLGTMRLANPVIPVRRTFPFPPPLPDTFSRYPSSGSPPAPVGDDSTSLHSAPPREYNQLPELKFSFSPDNKITSRIINRATELMLEAATQFPPGPVTFHLFVVAASSPMPGTWPGSVTMPTQIGQSEWRLLGQQMAQLGIHCHMILPASEDMTPMNELFITNLELQGHSQVSPWFPSSPDYTFLLSGNPSALDPSGIDQKPLLGVVRPPVLRHQSFPQDVQSTPAAASPPMQNGSTPTLVSSLQKVHGLSRKKLYGAQPPRQPFVREEPVRAKYKSTPTPLSIPGGSQPFPTLEDARTGKTKVDRGRRSDRPSVGDNSNSISPGRRSPWNRVASDVGSSPASPTNSHSSHHTTSPTIQPYPDPAGYPASAPTTSAAFSSGLVSTAPIPDMGFSNTLQDTSGSYFSMSPAFQSPAPSQVPAWTSMSKASNYTPISKSAGMPSANRRHSQELPHGSHMPSLTAMSSKYRQDNEARAIPKNMQKVKDAGDVPFIFSPELEAATAAKLKAALQSTCPVTTSGVPNQFTAFTSGSQLNYAAAEDAYTSSQPLQAGYELTPDAALAIEHPNCGDGEPHARFVGSTSSSLQGWAG